MHGHDASELYSEVGDLRDGYPAYLLKSIREPPIYVDYEDLTINIGYYKFHNPHIFQIK